MKEYLKSQRESFIFHLLVCVCVRCCVVDGGWSRWSPWSRCDKRCGGGRSIRTRSCSSPPPKNGGKKCAGEKNQVKPCNTKPCGESTTSCVWLVIVPAYGCLSTGVCVQPVQIASWQNSGTAVCVLSDDRGCPPGQEFVMCASQCPQRCSDLQQGIECQTNSECQPGCRCPQGTQVTPHMCVSLSEKFLSWH